MNELITCTKCKISQTRKNIVIPSNSLPEYRGMFITDTPTKREDMKGCFGDTYWKTIDLMLKDYGKSLDQFYITSAVKCCPEINRFPNEEEIINCRNFLIQEIMLIKPKVVIFFGDICAKYFISGKDNIINKCFQTRLCPLTIITENPKSLRKGTDKYLEFKGILRRFIASCLVT